MSRLGGEEMGAQKYYFYCGYCNTRDLHEVDKDATMPCVTCNGPTWRDLTPREEHDRTVAAVAKRGRAEAIRAEQQSPLWRYLLEECGLLKPKG